MSTAAPVLAHPIALPRLSPQIRETARVAGWSFLIALSAQATIPFAPVPLSLQSLVVLVAGALLGARRAAAAAALYLLEGAAGLPVFAAGGAGIAYLAGPTGGYLAGFLIAATVVGTLADLGWMRRPVAALAAGALGTLSLYLPGLAWLSVHVGWQPALGLGLLPFIPGDVAKIVAAAAVAGYGGEAPRS